MLENKMASLYKKILSSNESVVQVEDVDILCTQKGKKRNISMATLLYKGEKEIPLEIRNLAKEIFFTKTEVNTHLFIEEETASIYLCYASFFTQEKFIQAIRAFVDAALFWRDMFSHSEEETVDREVLCVVKEQ